MKSKKLTVLFLIIAIILSACASPGGAQSTAFIVLQIDNPKMTTNGGSVSIDTAPIVMNNRTLVPVRAVTEALGGSVSWDDSTKTATLRRGSDTIVLVINSTVAYLNGAKNTLDAAPIIYSGRTMLPIRYIAEGFGLTVSWNPLDKTITITDGFSPQSVPPFSGPAYVTVNGNKPYFTASEITPVSFEFYSDLDSLGRCGVCVASIGRDIMPDEPRSAIGQIKPSGWHTVKYDNVDGKYLYNRCHLLGFQLTGENSNEKNLITGTRFLNVNGMLPFENKVADFVNSTGKHVMYRATPIFEGTNLLASGVLLEALSVEDGGRGISFCVYCYNAQPGIAINYENGDSALKSDYADTSQTASAYILNTNTKKFHYPSCRHIEEITPSNRAVSNKTRDTLISEGYSPCGACKP